MLIYAHRGASIDFTEGSKAAYLGALAQGADGFECDVRLTKDKQIICYHDSDTKRLSNIDLKIAKSSYEELKAKVDPYRLDELLDLSISNKKVKNFQNVVLQKTTKSRYLLNFENILNALNFKCEKIYL